MNPFQKALKVTVLIEIKLSGRTEIADSVPVRCAETFPFAKAVHLDLEIPTSKAKTITIQCASCVIVAVVEAAVKSEGTMVVACYLVTQEKMWWICLPWHLFHS